MDAGQSALQTRASEIAVERAPRQFPLDALRGLIIVLMALDHANHFIAQQHSAGEYWGGPFPKYGTAFAFLIRFVTHLAAPCFFFLMGVGMTLFSRARRREGWGRPAIIGHFWLRGLLLIAMQLLVVNLAWQLSPGGWGLSIYIGVLFALGATMILGSLLLPLRSPYLLALTVLFFVVVEVLVPGPGAWRQPFSLFARFMLIPGGSPDLWVNYPILPWLGLVTFGLAYGQWLAERRQQAYRWTPWIGLVLILAALIVRYMDGFGNIRPRLGDTWIDFLNLVKYPPSIAFILLTLGAGSGILGLLARAGDTLKRFLQPWVVFGRVPLFFYLTHLFVYLALGLLMAPEGTSLLAMLAFWLVGLVILYPLCLIYGCFKHQKSTRSLWRLL